MDFAHSSNSKGKSKQKKTRKSNSSSSNNEGSRGANKPNTKQPKLEPVDYILKTLLEYKHKVEKMEQDIRESFSLHRTINESVPANKKIMTLLEGYKIIVSQIVANLQSIINEYKSHPIRTEAIEINLLGKALKQLIMAEEAFDEFNSNKILH
jgi:hypothetical protein